tara:strand:+ start:1870 stop:2913 length:1044 start_codon:yes stop_codon:yes gene_type:complete
MKRTNEYIKKFFNLIILGIGLGIISGSLLKISPIFYKAREDNNKIKKFSNWKNKANEINSPTELKELSQKWELLAKKNKKIDASGYLFLIDKGIHASYQPVKIFPAASTIKIPILLITLIMLDNENFYWDEEITMNKNDIAGGAGWMAYQPIGSSFPIHEIATEMIRVSDNTATNLLIKKIGGLNTLNEKLKAIGLKSTQLKSLLPDLSGTNTTTTIDLSKTIFLAESTNILTQRSRDLFRDILSTSRTNKLLPGGILKGLEKNQITLKDIDYKLLIKGYKVYNKTGDIGIAYADAGLIQMPNNTRAIASFIVKGPFNDQASTSLIREMASEMIPYIRPKRPKQKEN